MVSAKKTVMMKSACFALSAIFIGAGVRSTFAQDTKARGDQHRETQMERNQDNRAERNREGRVDRNRWDITDEAIEGFLVVKFAARSGFNEVDVEVQDGIAELSGQVSSKEARTRALRIANLTMGVRGVRDQLQVDASLDKRQSKSVPDRQLTEQVATKIAADIDGAKAGKDWWFDGWRVEGPFNRWNFVVEADDGTVTLEGEVPNLDIVRKAVESARGVAGVRTVDSDLEIERYLYHGERRDFHGGYYGYAYPYYPHVAPPYAWTQDQRRERPARGAGDQQRQSMR